MKLKQIINEETTPAIKKAIENIEKYTDNNQHSEAILELAELVGDKKAVKILKNIIEIHKLEGYMSQHLGKYRTEIRDYLLTTVFRKFGKDVYKAIYAAF